MHLSSTYVITPSLSYLSHWNPSPSGCQSLNGTCQFKSSSWLLTGCRRQTHQDPSWLGVSISTVFTFQHSPSHRVSLLHPVLYIQYVILHMHLCLSSIFLGNLPFPIWKPKLSLNFSITFAVEFVMDSTFRVVALKICYRFSRQSFHKNFNLIIV